MFGIGKKKEETQNNTQPLGEERIMEENITTQQPTAPTPTQPVSQPTGAPQPPRPQQPVPQPTVNVQPQQPTVNVTPNTQTVAPVVEESEEAVKAREQLEKIKSEHKDEDEKGFFASAFTTYLPITLSIIALAVYFVANFFALVTTYSLGSWFYLFARGTAVAGIVVEAIRQIAQKKFEFTPSLLVVLLTIFVVV